MEVRLYWWKHSSKTGQYPSAQVHRSLQIEVDVDPPKAFEDYTVALQPLQGLEPEVYD